jgi:hypothetical protein
VPTKILAWINYRFFGLDFAWQKIFNYLIFVGLIASLLRLKKHVIGSGNFILFPAFLVFLTSSIAYENHLYSYQSQIHFVLLFAVLALYFAYEDGLSTSSTIIFSAFLLAAINTFSAGVVISGAYLLCRSVYIAVLTAQDRISVKHACRSLGVSLVIVGAGVASWYSGYETNPIPTPRVSFFSGQFWDCYLDLVSFGFGFNNSALLPGAICLFVVLCPVILLVSRQRTYINPGTWKVTTGIIGILAVLAAIAVTRGALAGAGKTSRYAEIGFMLIPLAALAWWLVLQGRGQRRLILSALWFLLFISYFDNWTANPYRVSKQLDLFFVENLEYHKKEGGDFLFPDIYPFPIKDYFERAEKLDVHFTRQFTAPIGERLR